MKNQETFEELLTRLEDITTKLEKEENISLDESMKLFEEGIQISKKCNQQIEEAEKKITILIRQNDEIKEENFIQDEGNSDADF